MNWTRLGVIGATLAALTGVTMLAPTAIGATPSTAQKPATAQAAQTVKNESAKVVAFGDSFTAGFGFYGNGDWMFIGRIQSCRPTDDLNDACSSNSDTRDNTTPKDIQFSADYGFNNQISWAANFAWSLGIRPETAAGSYRNLAVTGSTARDWAEDKLTLPGGKKGMDAVEAERPDIVLMTLGGNPTLSDVLFGDGGKACVQERNPQRQFQCFRDLVTRDGTRPALRTVYTRLLNNTDAKVLVMLYPQVVPAVMTNFYSAEALLRAREALNSAVVGAIEDVKSQLPTKAWRLQFTGRDFKVGIPPGPYSSWAYCYGKAAYGTGTDGNGEQSVAAGGEFILTRGWAGDGSGYCGHGPTYVISQDGGIHPSQEGYRAMRDSAWWRWNNWPSGAVQGAKSDDDERADGDAQLLYTPLTRITAEPGEEVEIPLVYRGPDDRLEAKVTRQPVCEERPRSEEQVDELCTEKKPIGVRGIQDLKTVEYAELRKKLILEAAGLPGDYLVRLRLRDHLTHEDTVDRYISLRVRE